MDRCTNRQTDRQPYRLDRLSWWCWFIENIYYILTGLWRCKLRTSAQNEYTHCKCINTIKNRNCFWYAVCVCVEESVAKRRSSVKKQKIIVAVAKSTVAGWVWKCILKFSFSCCCCCGSCCCCCCCCPGPSSPHSQQRMLYLRVCIFVSLYLSRVSAELQLQFVSHAVAVVVASC